MDKASRLDISIDEQRTAWNRWNAENREGHASEHALRQAEYLEAAVAGLGRRDLEIIEVGCGSGWLCGRLLPFGSVTGLDLSDEVLARAAEREPRVKFVAGDFLQLVLPEGGYDLVVSIDTLSHFVDQETCIARIARLLRPGGRLLLGTQNGPVLERWSAVPGPRPGQVRHWVDHRRLRAMLEPHFRDVTITSLDPQGDQGLLRIANSVKLNALVGAVVGRARLRAFKERLYLGRTLMAQGSRG